MQARSLMEARRRSRWVMAAAFVAVFVGGIGFAAAGGVQAVKYLFHVEEWVAPNGDQMVDVFAAEVPDDGSGDDDDGQPANSDCGGK